GQTVGDFFAAEVTGPLGADFHIGLPAEHDHRVAATVPPPGRDDDYAASSAAPSDAPPSPGTPLRVRDGNSAAWRRPPNPEVGGYGNARSVALVQSVMACGGAVRGRRLLSQAGCERVGEEQGVDSLLGVPVRWGLGYALFGSSYGWGGWGGSIVMVDPGERMAGGYVTNQMREPADGTRGVENITTASDGAQGLRARTPGAGPPLRRRAPRAGRPAGAGSRPPGRSAAAARLRRRACGGSGTRTPSGSAVPGRSPVPRRSPGSSAGCRPSRRGGRGRPGNRTPAG